MKVKAINNKYLIWGAVAIGAYLVWKKMKNTNPQNNELTQTSGSNTQIGKPEVSPKSNPPMSKPSVNASLSKGRPNKSLKNNYLPNGCPTKEYMASARFGKAQMDKFREMGCI